MVVRPDGGFAGTIGGGALEWHGARRGAGAAGAAQTSGRSAGSTGARPRSRPMLRRPGRTVAVETFDATDLRRGRRARRRPKRRARLRRLAQPSTAGAGAAPHRRCRRWHASRHRRLRAARRRPHCRALRRRATPLLSVRRRPCRPRAGAGAGAVAVRGDLGRSAARCFPGACSGQVHAA